MELNSKQKNGKKKDFPHIFRFILKRHILYVTDRLFQTALAENGATAVTSLEAKYCPSLAAASRVRGVSQDKTLSFTTECLCM